MILQDFILALLLGHAPAEQDRAAASDKPTVSISGILNEPLLAEVSGAAGSRRDADILWLINDSGNGPLLFALSPEGELRATFEVDVRNHDWEDLAAYDHGDGPHLAIADVGDNGGVRSSVLVHVLREPLLPATESTAKVEYSLQLSYPDEPHDVESLAIDPTRPVGYLVSKRTKPPRLYRFDLQPQGPQVVREIGPLAQMPRLTEADLHEGTGFNRYRHQPTAMDFNCSGEELWILTYGSIQRYSRPAEGWDHGITDQQPRALALLPLPQAESLAFDKDCRNVYVLSELSPVPIVRYRLSE